MQKRVHLPVCAEERVQEYSSVLSIDTTLLPARRRDVCRSFNHGFDSLINQWVPDLYRGKLYADSETCKDKRGYAV